MRDDDGPFLLVWFWVFILMCVGSFVLMLAGLMIYWLAQTCWPALFACIAISSSGFAAWLKALP